MIRPFLLLFALIAGLMAAADDRWVVVVNDGREVLAEVPIYGRGVLSRSYVRVNRIPNSPQLPDQAAATGLIMKVSKVDDSVTIKVSAAFENPGTGPHSMEDMKQIEVASYSAALGATVIMDESARQYSLPALSLRIIREPNECGFTVAEVQTQVPTLIPELVSRESGVCYITVRNLSSKPVMAVGMGARSPDGRSSSGMTTSGFAAEDPSIRPMIPAGGTYRLQFGLPVKREQSANSTDQQLPVVTMVVFSDKSFVGDADSAMRILGNASGYAAQAKRAARDIREFLVRLESDPKLVPEFRAVLVKLPETDEDALLAASESLKPSNPTAFAEAFRSGMRMEKQMLLQRADMYNQRPLSNRTSASLQAYLRVVLEGATLVSGE